MQQTLGQFQPPLHAARKGLGFFLGPIRQSDARQHFRHARFQRRAMQTVEMALMPQILRRRQLAVDALRLKDHPNFPAQRARVGGRHRNPRITARPPEGTIRVERIRNSVVLPLPFGPSNPNNSARRTSKETPSSAVRRS